jgi:hypothetical protein
MIYELRTYTLVPNRRAALVGAVFLLTSFSDFQ